MCVMPVLTKNLPYDPFKDFRPLHGLSMGPASFIVKGDSPHKTIGDLIAAAKRDKRTLNVGNYSDGYMLVAAWLGTATGVPVNHIAYKGGAQMQTDVMGGSLDVGVNVGESPTETLGKPGADRAFPASHESHQINARRALQLEDHSLGSIPEGARPTGRAAAIMLACKGNCCRSFR